ncbi:MAG TPA: DUF5916 domain-containing protein, partial [Chitinophagaceae bacterium]|nr:DUF5916 domain-containing protein [Chitinophagaceae bacterium]
PVNYNILVFDQTLKNNSSISFINLNTIRFGSARDANVSAALFDFNDKKNVYNWSGKVAVSQRFTGGNTSSGYSHNWNFNKNGGRWNFNLGEEIASPKYNINDMGILFTNNYIDHYMWTAYRWIKPTKWYNRIQLNFNAYYSMLMKNVPGQKISSKFQSFNTNINGNMQLKSLWWVGFFVGYVPAGNDFYEPRVTGYSFRSPSRFQLNPWFNSNSTKKYYFEFNYFVGLRSLFNSPNHEFYVSHRYRFSDKFSVSHNLYLNPTKNDAGFYTVYDVNPVFDIIFSRRDLKTIENVVSIKYSFNNKSGITFRARHYWSKVEVKQLYDLQDDGTLQPTAHNNIPIENQNYNIFNIDAVYTLQFAPGSFLNIVWKDEGEFSDEQVYRTYFKNLDRTLNAPQLNNLSLKIVYYLDYLKIRNWGKKK